MGMLLIIWFLILAGAAVLYAFSFWRLFEKMGVEGWKGIIPVYNFYVLLRRLCRPAWWLVMLLLMPVLYVPYSMAVAAALYQGTLPAALFTVVYFIATVVWIVFMLKTEYALAKAFGYGAGFTAGLFLLPIVFYPILAFNDARFVQPLPERTPGVPPRTPVPPVPPQA